MIKEYIKGFIVSILIIELLKANGYGYLDTNFYLIWLGSMFLYSFTLFDDKREEIK